MYICKSLKCTYVIRGDAMTKDSLIPESIKKHIPMKCCRVRNDNGTYRVYKYVAVKLPSGKWGASSGILIGKIIPDQGFIPNKRYLKEFASETQPELIAYDAITDVSYGGYDLLISMSQDVLKRLETYFPAERAAQIYCYAVILCANGFLYIDQIDEFYQESFLSLFFRHYSFKMGYSTLSALLHDLGMRGNPVKGFEQSLIDESSKEIAIDGHVIRSCSQLNDLAEPGYKMNLLKAPQENLLIAYDMKNKMPVMYRTFRGSTVDKVSVIEFIESRRFIYTKFVVDRGFYSTKALKLMSENGNCYIIPLPSNNANFKRIKSKLEYTSGEFVYRSGEKDSARIIFYEEKITNKKRIIVYKDIDENNSKRKSYKIMIDNGENGYTQEKYEEYCEWWGVYFLETTTDETAEEVFSDYKDRWSIETYNNYIKNHAKFNNLKIQDYYIEHGFDFIMLVTGIIHSRLNILVKQIGKSSISTRDILIKASHMRMVLTEGIWKIRNTRTKDIELLAKIGFTPRVCYEI